MLPNAYPQRRPVVLPIWVYLVVAIAIAFVAFGIGQVVPGLGVPFVILASTLWAAHSVSRARKLKRNR
jgi:hypothetical protein